MAAINNLFRPAPSRRGPSGNASASRQAGVPGGPNGASNSTTGTDAFISYSRRDKDFVTRLYNALAGRSKEAWVDWEGIMPGEDWLRKIYSAIEAANAVIVVLSPDWISSETCGLEIAHTGRCNKRVIPIVYRDVNAHEIPNVAAAHNWIFFRDDDNFEAAMELLMQAIDMDVEWVRTHTRLLTRAVEWDANKRDISYALRGQELRQAESWFLKSGTFEPPPTQLQSEYIIASRTRANALRLRAFAGAITLTFAAILLILMIVQNRQRANLYLAQDLRAQAVWALADRDDHTAEVLLAKSITLDDRRSTRELLLDAQAHAARLMRVVHAPNSRVLAVSRDGTRFITTRNDGPTFIGSIAHDSVGTGAASEPTSPKTVGFSQDGSLAALVMPSRVDVFDAQSRHLRFSIPIKPDSVRCVAFSFDGATLATAGTDLTITTWNTATGAKIRAYRGHREEIDALAFSPDGRTLASGGWEDTVLLWDVASGRILHRLTGHEDVVLSCVFSPDGRTLATGSWDNTTRLWDVATGRNTSTLRGSNSGITCISFTADGRNLYTGSELGETRLWDVDAGDVRLSIPSPDNPINAVTILPDQRLITAGEDGDIQIWDMSYRDRNPEVQTLHGHTGVVAKIAISPDSHLLASAGMDMLLKLWDLRSGACLQTFTGHTAGIEGIAISPDGKTVASAGRDWTVRFWDIASGKPAHVIRLTKVAQSVLYLNRGAKLAVSSDDGILRIYDTTTYALLNSRFVGYGMYALAASRNSRVIAVGMVDGKIYLFSTAALKPITDMAIPNDQIWGLSFTPDGRRLYVGTGDRGVLSEWDILKKKKVFSLTGHEGGIWDLAMDSTGKRVATAGQDATVRLWDMTNGNSLRLGSADASLWCIAWSPDGSKVAAGGLGHEIHVWNIPMVRQMLSENPDDLLEQVEQSTGLTVQGHDVVPLPIGNLKSPRVDIANVN